MWSLLNKEESKISILQSGVTQKYLCTIESDIQIGTMKVATTTQCRWIVTVKAVNNDGYRSELLTLDNHIIETNNPSVYDVAALNNLFKEIYNELDVNVDFSGNLQTINNKDQIKAKWLRVRSQLNQMTANQESIASVVKLNDDIFDNDANLFHTIKAIEFFEIFFNGIYGKKLPNNEYVTRKSKFQAEDIDWIIKYTTKGEKSHEVFFEGENGKTLSADWLKKAYGHFIFIEPATLAPLISCNGHYVIDGNTGMVKQATYYTQEIVHTQLLYNKIRYTLQQY